LNFLAAVRAPFSDCDAASFQNKEPLAIDVDFDSALRGRRTFPSSRQVANVTHPLTQVVLTRAAIITHPLTQVVLTRAAIIAHPLPQVVLTSVATAVALR